MQIKLRNKQASQTSSVQANGSLITYTASGNWRSGPPRLGDLLLWEFEIKKHRFVFKVQYHECLQGESMPRKLCAVITVCMIHHIKTHKRAEGKQKCHFFFSSFELGESFVKLWKWLTMNEKSPHMLLSNVQMVCPISATHKYFTDSKDSDEQISMWERIYSQTFRWCLAGLSVESDLCIDLSMRLVVWTQLWELSNYHCANLLPVTGLNVLTEI